MIMRKISKRIVPFSIIFQWVNVLLALGTVHVVSSANTTTESPTQEITQEDLDHAWYQRLTKEKEKQEWSELPIIKGRIGNH